MKHQLEEAAARQSQFPDPGELDEKEIPIMDNNGRSRDARTEQSAGEVWNAENFQSVLFKLILLNNDKYQFYFMLMLSSDHVNGNEGNDLKSS